MSLKYFHIFFIVSALGLMTYVIYWGVSEGLQRGVVISAAVGVILDIGYLRWFLRKYKYLP